MVKHKETLINNNKTSMKNILWKKISIVSIAHKEKYKILIVNLTKSIFIAQKEK